eukprot:TRINITY_DN271_c0_g2_i2.p1 TRINITY_DN271_c0_g2~~TRINITY_DN271_c0_g2_i2.p1  ORF type:complete len:298 (-),score=86.25 TRINITY_DN271_c0_g2_i2:164-1057(-)
MEKAEKARSQQLQKKINHKKEELKKKKQIERKQFLDQENEELLLKKQEKFNQQYQNLVKRRQEREKQQVTRKDKNDSFPISKKQMIEDKEMEKCFILLKNFENQQSKIQQNLQDKLNQSKQNKAQFETKVARIKSKQQQQIQNSNQKNIQKLGEKLQRMELSSLIKEKTVEFEIQKRKQKEQIKNQQLQLNLSKIKELYDEKSNKIREKDSQMKNYSQTYSQLNRSTRSLTNEKHKLEVLQSCEIQKQQQFLERADILSSQAQYQRTFNFLKNAREKLKDYRLRARFLQKEQLNSSK